MARISGIDIPREKRVIASLRYIHGVGAKRAEDICSDLKIDPDTRVSNLTNDVSESNNLKDEYPEIVTDLKNEALNWRKEIENVPRFDGR